MQTRERRGSSFALFKAAHQGVAIEAMNLQLMLPAVATRHAQNVRLNVVTALDWLPVQSLKWLCIETGRPGPGLANVTLSIKARGNSFRALQSMLVRRTRCDWHLLCRC